jgi:nucleoid-associated protein YgaU
VAPAVLRRTVEAALGVSLVAGVVGTGPAYADAPVPLESPSPVLGDVGPFDRPVTASKAARPGHRPAPSASPTSSAVPTAAKPTPPLSAVVSVVPGNGSFLVEVPRPTTSVPVDRPADSPGLRAQRPTADPTLLSGPAAPAAPADAGVAVVQRGDTLWGLAARQLGPHATPADIDAQWRRWYAANRAVIGTDPDVIRPGQRLHAPSAPISRSAR